MMMPAIPGFRASHAVAFSDTAVTLMRRGTFEWEVVERVSVTQTDFAAAASGLIRHLGTDRRVALWMPPGHLLSVRLSAKEAEDPGAALAARTGHDPSSLSMAVVPQPATGDRIVFAVDRTTLGEAICYARDWGFTPVSATVRPDAVAAGPSPLFDHPDLRPQRSRRVMVAGLGAVAAAALVAVISVLQQPASLEATKATLAIPAGLSRAAIEVNTVAPTVPTRAAVEAAVLRMPGSAVQAMDFAAKVPASTAVPAVPEDTPQRPALRVASISPLHIVDAPALPPGLSTALVARPLPSVPGGNAPTQPPSLLQIAPALSDPAEDPGLQAVAETGNDDTVADGATTHDAPDTDLPLPEQVAEMSSPDDAASPEPLEAVSLDSIDPAEAARLDALATIVPPERPEQPVVAGLSAPQPVSRPRSIAAAARAAREAQAARAAASTAASRPTTTAAPPSGGSTAGEVARAATLSSGLPAGETGLIGVFANGSDRTALLRMADGRVARVRRGDNVEGWTVSSIDDTSVRLTGRSGARTLSVPQR